MRRLAAALALSSVWILAAGCGNCNQKAQTAPATSPAAPPVAVAALEGLLPSPADINTAMGASGMTVAGPLNEMWDNSAEIADQDCRFADAPAESPVYAGSGWTAVRGGALQEPGEFTHFVGLAVVSFPSSGEATTFFATSAERWPACSNRRFTAKQPDESDVVWTVGPVTNTDGMLVTSKTQESANHWICERALSVRNNVVIDVNACSNSPSGSAVNIVHQIAANVP